jgi:hypothetical protein
MINLEKYQIQMLFICKKYDLPQTYFKAISFIRGLLIRYLLNLKKFSLQSIEKHVRTFTKKNSNHLTTINNASYY